jgi:hypothetical protein
MVRADRYKYVHWQSFAPQLFDPDADPDEYCDLGRDCGFGGVRTDIHERLPAWFMRLKRHVTVTDVEADAGSAKHKRSGVFFGQW